MLSYKYASSRTVTLAAAVAVVVIIFLNVIHRETDGAGQVT